VGGALLMAHQHMMDLTRRFVRSQGIVGGQNGAAWVAKNDIDTFMDQRFPDHLGAGHLAGFGHLPIIEWDGSGLGHQLVLLLNACTGIRRLAGQSGIQHLSEIKKDPSRLGRVCTDLWVGFLYPCPSSNRKRPPIRKYYGYEADNKAYEYGEQQNSRHKTLFVFTQ
jgi:hypothetical protein